MYWIFPWWTNQVIYVDSPFLKKILGKKHFSCDEQLYIALCVCLLVSLLVTLFWHFSETWFLQYYFMRGDERGGWGCKGLAKGWLFLKFWKMKMRNVGRGEGAYWLVKILIFFEIWNFEEWKWEMCRGEGGGAFVFSIMLWLSSQLEISLCDSQVLVHVFVKCRKRTNWNEHVHSIC